VTAPSRPVRYQRLRETSLVGRAVMPSEEGTSLPRRREDRSTKRFDSIPGGADVCTAAGSRS